MSEPKIIRDDDNNPYVDYVDYSNFENHKPYDIKSLKLKPIDYRINKIVDILDAIVNHAYSKATLDFYNKMKSLLKDDL